MASEVSATEAFPFDGIVDRATESRYRILATRCWGRDSGVLYRGNFLAVTGDSTGMQVKVASGELWLDGAYGRFDTNPMILTGFSSVGVGSGQRRIYRVVAQTDWVGNTVKLVVKAGDIGAISGAGAAVPPVLTQVVDGTWEQSLAQVYIGNGDATITAAMVIDERTFARNPSGRQPGDLLIRPAHLVAVPGYFWCDGGAIHRITYAELFAVIGTSFGAGDGSTTFNLPDYRGETLAALDNMGSGAAGRLSAMASLAAHYGEQNHANQISEIPAHNHLIAHTHAIDHDHASFTTIGASGKVVVLTSGDTAVSAWADGSHPFCTQELTINVPALTGTSGASSVPSTSNEGGSAPHNNVQPTHMVYVLVAARPA